MKNDYDNEDGVMLIGGLKATDIAEEFGTPVYVTDEQRLRKNYRTLKETFAPFDMKTEIHYASKANTNLAILSVLRQEGSGIDAVSVGEVKACLKAGFDPADMIYTGVNVSNQELKEVSDLGVLINLDSESAIERLAAMKTGIPVSIRVNPGIGTGYNEATTTGNRGSKFGIPEDRIIDAYLRAQDLGLEPVGIHAHIGSGGNDISPFIGEAQILAGLIERLSETGIDLEFVDVGGGIPVPYRPNEEGPDLHELASEITDVFEMETDVRRLIIEPGRYIVGDTTVLLSRCVDVKDAGVKKYVGIDAGFNNLIRPAMYGAYHHIEIANKMGKACTGKYDVAGPLCESGDIMGKNRVLPNPEEGDLLAIYTAGAYGFSMSSHYNTRPLCAEVLVNEGKAELIREREAVEDIWRLERVPARLAK